MYHAYVNVNLAVGDVTWIKNENNRIVDNKWK